MAERVKRYTVYFRWSDLPGIEEVDVDAKSKNDAIFQARSEAGRIFRPNWVVVSAKERFGLYF